MALLLLPILLLFMTLCLSIKIANFIQILAFSLALFNVFIIPILYFGLFVMFGLKIKQKNKTKKDYIIVALNIFAILFCGIILFFNLIIDKIL